MNWPLVIARWMDIWASALLASVFVFDFVIVSKSVRRLPEFGALSVPGLFHRLAWIFWSLGIISSLLWLWTISAEMAGVELMAALSPEIWFTVLSGTQFGHLWVFRITVAVIFGLVLIARRRLSLTGRASFCGALAAIHLLSLAWAGHAAAGIGAGAPIRLANDSVHLALTAFWPGGLVPLAVLFLRLLKSGRPALLEIAAGLTRRFSTTSLFAVLTLSGTGLINSIFLVGDIQAMFTTSYGRLLLAKLVLFAAMVGIGAWNLLVLKPQLPVKVQPENVVNQNRKTRSLFRNVLWEIGLGTALFFIVGMLGMTSPPVH